MIPCGKHWNNGMFMLRVLLSLPLREGRSLGEYSTTKKCTIFTGTWNLNGRVGAPCPSLDTAAYHMYLTAAF